MSNKKNPSYSNMVNHRNIGIPLKFKITTNFPSMSVPVSSEKIITDEVMHNISFLAMQNKK